MTVLESFAIELTNFGPDGNMGPYSFEVRLYDTHTAFLRASRKYMRKIGSTPGDAHGCFQYPDNPGYNQHVGVLRFHAERLPIEFVAHECVHAAVMAAKCERGRGLRLPLDDTRATSEEMIAYGAGLLTEAILTKLADYITAPQEGIA